MKDTIVIYYSNNGSNRFLAQQIAARLHAEIEEIKPVFNLHLLLLMGIGLGNKKLEHQLSDYKRVVLCGPVWMGKFIYPLKSFVRKHKKNIRELIFVTCCASSYEAKDEKYGHGLVFEKLKQMIPKINVQCAAFPIPLILPDEKKKDPELVMNTRLNEESFKGEIVQRFNDFIGTIAVN